MQLRKNIIFSAVIFAASFFLILLWGKFDPEVFLYDDNRLQWYPIIEKAYDNFFETGVMPTYDFFQMKGLAIAEPGYYAIVNPMMLISYMISHFTPFPFSTITIHIALLFSLGNLCFFLLCREFGQSVPMSALLTAAYSVGSCFFSFSNWYYVFNNYLFIPLLFLIFIKCRDRKLEYFGCGIVLALGILFGNVQYTCYHYMVYGLICLIFVILKSRRYIAVFFSNIFCAVSLSSPFLLMLLRASGSFDLGGFHACSIPFSDLILGAVIPVGIFEFLGVKINVLHDDPFGTAYYTWLYNGGIAVIWLVLFVYAVIWLIKQLKQFSNVHAELSTKERIGIITDNIKSLYKEQVRKNDDKFFLIAGMVLCVLFFVSLMCDGVVALILGHMPVIKQFRFLFKGIFVLEPILAVLTAAVLPNTPAPYMHRQKPKIIAAILCCIFTVIGTVNTYASVSLAHTFYNTKTTAAITIEEEKEYGRAFDEIYILDSDSFRYITLMQNDTVITSEVWFNYFNGYLRNFPTAMELYAISGYELSAPISHMEQFSRLYPTDSVNSRLIGISSGSTFAENVNENHDEVSQQLISNSVKYIYVHQNDYIDARTRIYNEIYGIQTPDYTGMVAEAVENLEGVRIAEIRSLNDYFDVIVLEGVNGLCEDSDGNALPLTAERMDLLSFEDSGASEYTLSFSYEDKLTAYTVDTNGKRLPLEISEADDGNTVIHSSGGNGRIYLGYKDILCTIGFVFEVVIIIAFLAMLAVLAVTSRKASGTENKGETA